MVSFYSANSIKMTLFLWEKKYHNRTISISDPYIYRWSTKTGVVVSTNTLKRIRTWQWLRKKESPCWPSEHTLSPIIGEFLLWNMQTDGGWNCRWKKKWNEEGSFIPEHKTLKSYKTKKMEVSHGTIKTCAWYCDIIYFRSTRL